jgi:acetate kinase
MQILVINAGSSSIKFAVYDMGDEQLRVSGEIERIGEPHSQGVYRCHGSADDREEKRQPLEVPDHAAAMARVFDYLQQAGVLNAEDPLTAIGHRVVHGGERFQRPTLIDDPVLAAIGELVPLAPLHNPANLACIEATRQRWPRLPQVAVFDTAFFRRLPEQALRYALPERFYRDHQVCRYGFHGTSHEYVAGQAAQRLGRPLEQLRLISLHLGNGASAAAIRHGQCIDTSMGMTPLEGLVMGSRCGDMDPAIPFYLARQLGMDLDEIENLLNRNSGLQGLCGANDMRRVHELVDQGDASARLALDMYCYRIVKYIGAYYAALGGLDGLIFTAGVGENDEQIRARVCHQLTHLGLHLDDQRNEQSAGNARLISAADSPVNILVIPTNEERAIARQTMNIIEGPR